MSAKKSDAGSKGKEARESRVTAEEVLAEYEGARVQAESLRESLDLISNTITELAIVRNSLNVMKEMPDDNDILMSLGGGSFARARVTDRERVVVGIGSNVAIGKSVAEAMTDVEKRTQELEKLRDERSSSLQKALYRLDELGPTVQAIMARVSKEG